MTSGGQRRFYILFFAVCVSAGFPQFSNIPVPVHLHSIPGHRIRLPSAPLSRHQWSHATESKSIPPFVFHLCCLQWVRIRPHSSPVWRLLLVWGCFHSGPLFMLVDFQTGPWPMMTIKGVSDLREWFFCVKMILNCLIRFALYDMLSIKSRC